MTIMDLINSVSVRFEKFADPENKDIEDPAIVRAAIYALEQEWKKIIRERLAPNSIPTCLREAPDSQMFIDISTNPKTLKQHLTSMREWLIRSQKIIMYLMDGHEGTDPESMTKDQRLAEIANLIEMGDMRILASDGSCEGRTPELTQKEFRRLYLLAKGKNS